jgi:2-methylfumaryl-CoA isomerase
LVGAQLAARPFESIAPEFERHGVCWSRYQSVSELVRRDPACSADNPLFAMVDQAGVGPLLTPTIALDFAAGGRRVPSAAPRLGAHTDAVLAEFLGLGAAQLANLRASGIIA